MKNQTPGEETNISDSVGTVGKYPISAFEYEVARLAWAEGMTSSSILDHKKMEKTPQNFTRVRRALERAVKHGLLVLVPPVNLNLEAKLKEKYGTIEIHVGVDDDSTVQVAAKLIAKTIGDLLAERTKSGNQKPVVVANAGGRTIRDTLNHLQREVPLPLHGPDNLLSLSLNAAQQPKRFDECANSLCVRLAEIYGGKHFAVVKDPEFDDEYSAAIEDIDLLISSVGASGGLLDELLTHNKCRKPKDVVGDIGFHLINANAGPVPLDAKLQRLFAHFHVSPSWDRLGKLFRQKRAIVIIRESTGGVTKDERMQKLGLARALFDNSLISRCVITRSIGEALLQG